MQSAQEFMENFLCESKEIHRATRQLYRPFQDKFFSKEYVKHFEDFETNRENNPETIENVEVSDDSAKVIVVRLSGSKQRRFRYQLRISRSTWEIHMQEMECGSCNGKGYMSIGVPCNRCNGAGWIILF
jgi:hypothetical protein